MDSAERVRTLWSLGEYERVAERLAPAAEVLVDATGVTTGSRVLDVAAGTGNVSVAALARGAQVTASDIAPAMVEKGRARTGDDVEWHEADAQDLPFDDGAFDQVLSAFGAMFAPDPRRATAEMLRVGEIVAMTTWVMEGIQRAASEALDPYLPARPPSSLVPERWGDPHVARDHFEAHGANVTIQRRTLDWVFDGPEAWLELFERYTPPVVAARKMIGEDTWPSARADLLEAVRAHGQERSVGFVLEPDYLLIVAHR
jgi:SAM-dependent methyltransferase